MRKNIFIFMQKGLAFNHSISYCLRMSNSSTFRPIPNFSDETNEIIRKAYEIGEECYREDGNAHVQAFVIGYLGSAIDKLLHDSKNKQ
jgi:hypothetical protein